MRRKNVLLENIEITDLAAEGKAIARAEGKIIFVTGAIPGDVVNIQLTKSKKDWAEAKVTKLITPSPHRITPTCTHFGHCGGCKWQMLPYQLQLQYKQNEVLQNLTRLGKVQLPIISPIMGCTQEYAYRNKLEFTFSNKRYRTQDEIGEHYSRDLVKLLPYEPALGYHIPRLYDKVLDITQCHLMQEPMNEIRNGIKAFALLHGIPFYDIKQRTGWLRNLVIRLTTTKQLMLNLVVAHPSNHYKQLILNYIVATYPQVTSLLYTINAKANDTIYDLPNELYHGTPNVVEELGEFRFNISATSFFQTNTKQALALYNVTKAYTEMTGTQALYDLYCGTGSIGIYCSKLASKVVGVELIPQAVADAQANAALNNIHHAQFIAGDVAEVCNDDFFATHGHANVVVTDPPRAGMHPALVQKIVDIKAPIVVYVSCNTATQARDLQLLNSLYTVEKVQPVDMFPHTHHIENVVQLKLR